MYHSGAIACCQKFSILRQMLHTPKRWLLYIAAAIGCLDACAIATIVNARCLTVRTLLAEVEHEYAGIQCAHRQPIRFGIFVVKFDVTNALPNICLPPNGHRSQIEQFDVAVIIAGTNASFACVKRIAKCHGPAILSTHTAFGFLQWHETHDGTVLLPWIPHFDTTILTAGDDFQCATLTVPARTIHAIDDARMGGVRFEYTAVQSFDIPTQRP